ncbi:hypothetical protein [Polyangium aurulentum]|uniref:hypothetical protein n=1 Tax=Polyangium aurulentum TaxID=2567896 RepID=UPI00146A86FE|nr:hypothetical protein [Polyangium aurulentum]UQA60044.1 hypothetical protein E8A73_006025 [Polyangium aurulentum]
MKKSYLWAGAVVCFASTGCALSPADEMGEDEGVLQEAVLRIADANDIEHACEHVQNPSGGAYTNVSAVSSGTAPAISEHVPYNITLPLVSGTYKGRVRFTAGATEEHGIYVDPSTTIVVRQGTTAVTAAWSTTLNSTNCPASQNQNVPTYGTSSALSKVVTYNFTSGVTYTVEFTNSQSTMLGLVEDLSEQ